MTGAGCQDILNASWKRGRSERPGGGARSRATAAPHPVPPPPGAGTASPAAAADSALGYPAARARAAGLTG